jgi:dienelactone hydrolase
MRKINADKTGHTRRMILTAFLMISGILMSGRGPIWFSGSGPVKLNGSDDELTVLPDSPGGIPPGNQLEAWLKDQFYDHLENRHQAFEQLASRKDCELWQRQRRDFFVEQIGGFPERTPLNAHVVGQLEGKGYCIEKVMFESRPKHHVTASLYLPLTEPPYPAVLVPCGHSYNGKAAGHYQRVCILLARNGMAALCYDPIGQGERYQILNYKKDQTSFTTASHREVPHPRVQFLPTIEHTAMGLGCILLGSNVAQYRIWDGMRAIDYLQERWDIIADRIGCTGNSGGGTMTAYLMALDERIVAAAPACYLTTFRKLIDTRGAQDAEQNIYGQIAFGMDEPDYLMMRAPRPTLICAATRDKTFDIEGTWDLFRQAKRFYTRMRHGECVDLVEADALHGFTIQLREASVQWMKRWLLGIDEKVREVDLLPDPLTDWVMRDELSEGDWTQEELYCSPEGQVMLMPGEESVFQLNETIEETLKAKRERGWKRLNGDGRRELVRQRIGAGSFDPAYVPRVESAGKISRDGYFIEKLVLLPEGGLRLPALAFVPDEPNGHACLYLHGESMKTDARPGGPIEALVRKGQVVLAAELRGIGETETGHDKPDYGRGRFGIDVQEVFLAYLIGQSFVGMRVDDVGEWARFLENYRTLNEQPNKLHLVATGETAIPALHAAALDPGCFVSVRLQKMIRSWSEVVSSPQSLNQAVNTVHGVLQFYDLPDLVDLAGRGRVSVENPVDVMGNPLSLQ